MQRFDESCGRLLDLIAAHRQDGLLDLIESAYALTLTAKTIERDLGPYLGDPDALASFLDDEQSERAVVGLAAACELAYVYGINPDGARRLKRALWLSSEQMAMVRDLVKSLTFEGVLDD